MAKNIPTTQWTRLDEPVLDLVGVRIVDIGGALHYVTPNEATELPTAGRLAMIDGILSIQLVGEY